MSSAGSARTSGTVARWASGFLAVLLAVLFVRSALSLAGLDHAEGLAHDFTTYHAQARGAFREPPVLLVGWLYPPFALFPFLAFSPFPRFEAGVAWLGVEVLLAGLLGWMCARELRGLGRARALALSTGLVAFSLPVMHCIKWGQVSLGVVLLAVSGLRAGPRVGPALLGAAAAIKIYPVAYLVDPIVHRDRRRTLLALSWAAGLGILAPLVVFGPDLCWRIFSQFVNRAINARNGNWMAGHPASWWGGQSLSETLSRWFVAGDHVGLEADASPLVATLPQALATLATLLMTALLLGVTWRALRRDRRSTTRTALVTITAATLLVPPGWHHYFVVLPLAAARVLGDAYSPRAAKCAAVASVGISALPVLLLADAPEFYFEYSRWGGTTIAALLAWVALAWPGRTSSELMH